MKKIFYSHTLHQCDKITPQRACSCPFSRGCKILVCELRSMPKSREPIRDGTLYIVRHDVAANSSSWKAKRLCEGNSKWSENQICSLSPLYNLSFLLQPPFASAYATCQLHYSHDHPPASKLERAPPFDPADTATLSPHLPST